MTNGFDPEILQDFLTESGELLEQVEGDLVTLEHTPSDPELLNKIFRALHTIKGSASFLALTNLVKIAHAAESALNSARNGVVVVDRAMMDLLLQAIDTIKTQMGQLSSGTPLVEPNAQLVSTLAAIGEGKAPSKSAAPVAVAAATPAAAPVAAPISAPVAATVPASSSSANDSESPISLPDNKRDLLEFLVADLDDTLNKMGTLLEQLAADSTRPAAASALAETSESLLKSVDFFEIAPMTRLAKAMQSFGSQAADLDAKSTTAAVPAAKDITTALRRHIDALKRGKVRTENLDPVVESLEHAIHGEAEAPEAPQPAATTSEPASTPDAAPSAPSATVTPTAPTASAPAATDATAPAAAQANGQTAGQAGAAVEQTIRVEVRRLEQLMNLVGELVLQKNRISAVGRNLFAEKGLSQNSRDAVTVATEGLDRVTADIQLAVMRTRMQPLEKLFGKYPRLIRDLARKTNKKIDLVIEGGETEVDKSVIDELGDPLIHLLRNSADHGIETPEDRVKAGKSDTGTIKLAASHEGSHVRILVVDDGKGLVRDRIAKKAIERGLVTEAEVAGLSDREVYKFIMLPGFSTAEKVSDLSGRGVGMDVVKTNIEKLKGTIDLHSTPGKGSTIEINIPLTVAIMPAMMVGVGNPGKREEIYAVPLGNILEIVKPDPKSISTIGERPVMRLRDSVLPLFNAADLFGYSGDKPDQPFAVVLSMGEKTVGLLVSRLIGQQEIVIKPLDSLEPGAKAKDVKGPVSGATVRDDGGVSLIVDVAQLIKMGQDMKSSRNGPAASAAPAKSAKPASTGGTNPAPSAPKRAQSAA
ncbi:MAG: chemotaxis protein CheA [Phycisphaerales bacterium]|nr:chemotaxis protein CheA [Phycisphaerales bacterium]